MEKTLPIGTPMPLEKKKVCFVLPAIILSGKACQHRGEKSHTTSNETIFLNPKFNDSKKSCLDKKNKTKNQQTIKNLLITLQHPEPQQFKYHHSINQTSKFFSTWPDLHQSYSQFILWAVKPIYMIPILRQKGKELVSHIFSSSYRIQL